ncbi:MAG: hypothetical protein ACI8S6_004969 [Myxococcota bacterium]|jgi:hypothetical protein
MRAIAVLLISGALLLAGCPQPPEAPTGAPDKPGLPVNQPPPAAGTPDAPPPGEKPEEQPAAEATPPVEGGAPSGCEWAGVDSQWSKYDETERVRIAGDLSYEGDAAGHVLLDLLSADKDILLSVRCAKPGPFEVSVPKGLGATTLVAIIDSDFNGPTRNDAAGRTAEPVDIQAADIDGVTIALAAGADLGDITLPDPAGREAFVPPDSEIPPAEAEGEAPEGDEPGGAAPNPYK